jgi:hypothetical protein
MQHSALPSPCKFTCYSDLLKRKTKRAKRRKRRKLKRKQNRYRRKKGDEIEGEAKVKGKSIVTRLRAGQPRGFFFVCVRLLALRPLLAYCASFG